MHYISGLGDDLFSSIVSDFDAAKNVAEDPCLTQIANQILTLHNLQQAGVPGAPSGPGIGLCDISPLLNYWIWIKQQPSWFLPVVGAGLVGGLIAIGYSAGKRSGHGLKSFTTREVKK